jgi:hypothetical protein
MDVAGRVRSFQLDRLPSGSSKAVAVACRVRSYSDSPAVAASCTPMDVAGRVRSAQLAID